MDKSTELEVQRSLGRLEGKADQVLDHLERSSQRLDALELRTGKVEKWQSRALGWTVGVSGTVSVVYAIVSLLK